MKFIIKCPNLCLNGKVKQYSNPQSALYDLVDCKYCEGLGAVPINKAEEIDKQI